MSGDADKPRISFGAAVTFAVVGSWAARSSLLSRAKRRGMV
jgi:hypothetical protein